MSTVPPIERSSRLAGRAAQLRRYAGYAGYALLHPVAHSFGRCNVCGHRTCFVVTSSFRGETGLCVFCRSFARNRILVRVLLEEEGISLDGSLRCDFAALAGKAIWELASTGAVARELRRSPRFYVSEYDPATPSGRPWRGTATPVQDACATSFEDARFDVVISQGVMEHIPDYMAAFREIRRVLRPGGYHVFTVPSPLRPHTIRRAEVRDGAVVHLLPPSYHGNPIDRTGGSLCYTEFGEDVVDALREAGCLARIFTAGRADFVRNGIWPGKQVIVARRPVA
jgi:SAM-dependent methyltransferase